METNSVPSHADSSKPSESNAPPNFNREGDSSHMEMGQNPQGMNTWSTSSSMDPWTPLHAHAHAHSQSSYQPSSSSSSSSWEQYATAPQNDPSSGGTRRSGGGLASTWKKLLGRVEQGLDGLVQLEDTISSQAQQLVSSYRVASTSQTPSDVNFGQGAEMGASYGGVAQGSQHRGPIPPEWGPSPDANQNQQASGGSVPLPQKRQAVPTASGISSDPREGEVSQQPQNSMTETGTTSSNQDYAQQRNPSSPLDRAFQREGSDDSSSRATQHPNTSTDTYSPDSTTTTTTSSTPVPSKEEHVYTTTPKTESPFVKTSTPASQTFSQLLDYDASARGFPSSPTPPTSRDTYPDVDDESDRTPILEQVLSSIRIPNPLKLFRRKDDYHYASVAAWLKEDDAESNRRKKRWFPWFSRSNTKQNHVVAPSLLKTSTANKNGQHLPVSLENLLGRSNQGKSTNLLSKVNERQCRSLGRRQAVADMVSLILLVFALDQINPQGLIQLPRTLQEIHSIRLLPLANVLSTVWDTFAPELLLCTYLMSLRRRYLQRSKRPQVTNDISNRVEEESQYAQLYLRLTTSAPLSARVTQELTRAGIAQSESLMARARLGTLVTFTVVSLLVLSTSFVGPIMDAIFTRLGLLMQMQEWRKWPIEWVALGNHLKDLFVPLGSVLVDLATREWSKHMEDPTKLVAGLSLIVSLLLVTRIPALERRRMPGKTKVASDNVEGLWMPSNTSTQRVSLLGTSSSSRLGLLSVDGSLERILEHWRLGRDTSASSSSGPSILSMMRQSAYSILLLALLVVPVAASYAVGMILGTQSQLSWRTLSELLLIAVLVFPVARDAIRKEMQSSQFRPAIQHFLDTLSKVVQDRTKQSTDPSLQFLASVSPTAGLVVKDLWAAHSCKRAWAVRGANLECPNGQVMVIVGDDSAGKSRLVTAIAEGILKPPADSATCIGVRGYVGVGGVDVTKWDTSLLKKRVGLYLSDVRRIADAASVYTGWTLEEVLEPVRGMGKEDSQGHLTASERSCMLLALKITGLYGSVSSWPSRLSTVLTSKEEDLRPTAVHPRPHVLSPAEWSKLLLSQVLAQSIYDNDNTASSSDKVENSLVGSILLLDDPTVLLGEVEEAHVLEELRQTGAATILTTNQWATGRFADIIVVVKDGAIVESGSHVELIARGPQESLYAAKWHAMTML
eukprot:Nitzschia sp. Nitz4//scaffold257_size48314//22424//26190//NITZ4_007091-RA/size48314-processed-gene-0.33-mRNA-1//1//CDS//3329544454//6415//frame0